MKPITALGLGLMVAGMLVMIYGGFSFTKKTHTAKLGSVQLSVNERQNVYIPLWIGITSLVVGGGILLSRSKKK